MPPRAKPVEERIWKYIDVRGERECWPWTASTGSNGYGQINAFGRMREAHRVLYTLVVGDVPATHHVHHLCANTLCCNPSHLASFLAFHHKRITAGLYQRAKTHCIRGHEFTPENTYVRPGGIKRECRACKRKGVR